MPNPVDGQEGDLGKPLAGEKRLRKQVDLGQNKTMREESGEKVSVGETRRSSSRAFSKNPDIDILGSSSLLRMFLRFAEKYNIMDKSEEELEKRFNIWCAYKEKHGTDEYAGAISDDDDDDAVAIIEGLLCTDYIDKEYAVNGDEDAAAIMDDDAGPQSLFVVVNYNFIDKAPYCCSILQLDTDDENQHHENDQVIETEFSVHFRLPQPRPQPQLAGPVLWSCSPLANSPEDLYIVPDFVPQLAGKRYVLPEPLHGCIYNLRNNECKPIKPPQAPKHNGYAVSMGGHLYLMAHPRDKYLSFPVFERHNPLSDCWEPREPFPFTPGAIMATAVLDDTILFNILGNNFFAYNGPNNKWYPVIVDNYLAYRIRGQAVVLGNTIYALEHDCFNLVLVFSLGREGSNGDLEFRFSLVSTLFVSGMKEIPFVDKFVRWPSNLRHLAYLGNHNFCLVRSCELSCELSCPKAYQSIQVINMKLEGKNSMTLKSARFYKLKIEGNKPFIVCHCFSLPNCTTTAIEEGKPSVVEFDPFPKYTDLKRGDNTDCHGDHAYTTPEVLNNEARLLRIITQPKPAYHAAYRYSPPPPRCYQHPDYQYPQAPAIPSPPPYYQHPAYHLPRAPAIPSPPPYYQRPMPHPPNTPRPWLCNPQQPLLLPPTDPKTNNQRPPYRDYCQLCGLEGHFATNCSTYTYYNNLPRPRPPWPTTLDPLMQEEETNERLLKARSLVGGTVLI